MKKNRILSLLLAAVMLLSTVGVVDAEGSKYTTETTKDGWIKVINEGGATLGYSPDSGVTILEDGGYAFKDLNRSGTLDAYEDWRLDAETRAENLVSLLPIADQIPLMLVNRYDTNYKPGEISDYILGLLDQGVRGLSTPFAFKDVKNTVAYINGMQAYVEAKPFGIPIDEHGEAGNAITSTWMNNLSFGATFDPSLVGEYARAMSEEYRAIGITTTLTPQIDISTEPRWSRITGTFGEDPQLSSDMAREYVNGLQSTYAADGTDLGWGEDSINAMMKHFPGDGAGESGRESHNFYGAYTVYPGDNFYTHLLPFQAGLELPGLTGAAAAVMPSYSIAVDADGEPMGDAVGSGFSAFKLTETLREEMGFTGLVCSDFIIVQQNAGMGPRNWGVEDLTVPERYLMAIEAGLDQFGGEAFVDDLKAAYDLGVEKNGEEAMNERIKGSAKRILKNMFQIGLFENPYLDTAESKTIVANDEKQAAGYKALEKSVVMLKNSGNIIHAAEEGAEKPTIYIPMTYASGKWSVPLDLSVVAKYFNVVTDTVAETLTGAPDKNGKATASETDIIRATAEQLAEVDYAFVRINSPANVGGGYDAANEKYIPLSLQYGEYVANSAFVRQQSIGGNEIEVVIDSPYGAQTVYETENRSYFGNKAVISNASDLDAVLYAAEHVDKVIVNINISNPMIVAEFEDKVDAILVTFAQSGKNITNVLCDILAGTLEPSGLMPLQMPANMETVEAQYEDVPRDMDCHVDTDGNTYDFAFGLDWNGVINDERVEKYNKPALEG